MIIDNMTIEELKKTTFDWNVRNGWPIFDCEPRRLCNTSGYVSLQTMPTPLNRLTKEWAEFLKNQGVELEFFDATWKQSFGEFNPDLTYRIPKPKMRNKRPDELPYKLRRVFKDGSLHSLASLREMWTEEDIECAVEDGQYYTTNGTDRHSFQI